MSATLAIGGGRLWSPLARRDFTLVWAGQTVSLLGDQFHFVALTWLTLQVTGSGLALGTVLMLGAVPRALFMLVGGVTSDRIPPRTVMLLSDGLRAALVAVIAALVLAGTVQLWHLYLLSLAFGLADAFFYPAFAAIVPALVAADQLEAGNALLRGSQHLSHLLGPAAGGVVVATIGSGPAFVVDAASFLVATLTLLAARVPAPARTAAEAAEPREGILAAIRAGLRYAWRDPVIRGLLVIVAAVDFGFVGPMNVGLAALAEQRFGGDATTFGLLLSAFGAGALVGVVLAGALRRPRHRGWLLLGASALMGLLLALLGLAPTPPLAALDTAIMGLGSGLLNVLMVSWLQGRVVAGMLGRVMSLVQFASFGLGPLSYALAGLLVDLHAAVLFGAAGLFVMCATLAVATNRPLRELD